MVATPARTVCDDNARALERHQALRFLAMGTRRGSPGIPESHTRLKPAIGLAAYAAARTLSVSAAESFRFRLHAWFDHWVKSQLRPGDHILSSYGYVNACFQWVREHGGKTFLDAGNSHPENFWTILSGEHRRWGCASPPIPRHQHARALAMLEDVDFVLSPSSFVTRSFLERGFKPAQILRNVYPVDLSCFKPPVSPRPANRPLTIIAPGSLSLRKGTPYLLEALRLVLRQVPGTRLILNRLVTDQVRPVLRQYADLLIDWRPPLTHPQLAEALGSSDMLVLPSLEDGFARTVTEGLSCGLPVITTPNTGASDLIVPGVNGEVVPIRDAAAIAQAILKWHDRVLASGGRTPAPFDAAQVSFATFEAGFIRQLRDLQLIPPAMVRDV